MESTAPVLPPKVEALVGEDELIPVTVGRSGAATWRVIRERGDWFVKAQPAHRLATSLVGEAERLRWLAVHQPVPEVVDFGNDDEVEWLVMTALRGSDATRPDHGAEPERLIHTLGVALRRFHDTTPVADCPFDSTTTTDLDRARQRIEADLVDSADFAPLYSGLEADELFEMMIATGIPDQDDQVVLHGDYCVPNVIINEGAVSGFVDVGRCGVGDRHRDLGIAARSMAYNFGGPAVGLFLDSYGVERPDLARLDFYVMLDEFF